MSVKDKQAELDEFEISTVKKFSLRSFFLQWEWLLVLILVLIFIMNANLSPNFLNVTGVFNSTKQFLDKGFMVFPMALVLLLGAIDISVGATAALCAVVLGLTFEAGLPFPIAVLIALLVGLSCGLINGILVSQFEDIPPMILTLGTMGIFRGLAYILLENNSISGFPKGFINIGWGNVAGIPIVLIVFLIFAGLFIILLHKTVFGREVKVIGYNKETARVSGIKVNRNIIIVFALLGFCAAVSGLFLTSRMSSVRADIALQYELEVIAMVVLGGVSTSGGIGKMFGPIISVFIIGFLRYGLGLINVSSQIITLIIGLLLVGSVLVTNLDVSRLLNKKLKN